MFFLLPLYFPCIPEYFSGWNKNLQDGIMTKHQITECRIYPLYVAKAEKKVTKEEVDEIIRWLTGAARKSWKSTWKSRPTLRHSLRKLPK